MDQSGGLPAVYTLDEAAALLRVKKSWLERQAAARRIPFTMLGGAYHFTTHHLTAIVRLHEIEPRRRDEPVSRPGPARRRQQTTPPTPSAMPLRPRPRTGPRHAA
jgi:excisionase family DNA binding protein